MEVADGEQIQLDVKREGYVARTVVLDGKTSKLLVTLDRQRSAAPVRQLTVLPVRSAAPHVEAPPPPPKKKSNLNGGEIVDPWEH